MRVRVVRAFSGNNSGTYVLVGTFVEERVAGELAAELAEAFATHARWLGTRGTEGSHEVSPLHAYASAQGVVTDPRVGADDDWPHYGSAPRVEHLGVQVLVFVDYSVTFPRFVGELVYRRGGRVAVELDHSHHPIVVSHTIWKHEGWNDRASAERAVSAFRAEVEDGALAELYRDPSGSGADRAPPVVSAGFWAGQVQLVHAPLDVAAGARAVTMLAEKHGLSSRLALFETPVHGLAADPIRGYRVFENGAGEHQVILWKPGGVVADTVRALRSVTGIALAEATELVARAPVEIVTHVSERDGAAARDALTAAGADAELLGPQHFRRDR